jgi:hypothetical protein
VVNDAMYGYGDVPPKVPVRVTPFMSPLNNYAGTIVVMTNPSDELYKLELVLKGLIDDGRGGVRSVGEPLLNEFGVNSVLGLVRSVVNRNTIMSNLDKGEVSVMMDFLGDTISRDLMMNRITYGITSPAARDKIFFNCMSLSFGVLKRGFEEGDKRFWKGSQQDITMRNEGMQPKKGLISRIGGLLR